MTIIESLDNTPVPTFESRKSRALLRRFGSGLAPRVMCDSSVREVFGSSIPAIARKSDK